MGVHTGVGWGPWVPGESVLGSSVFGSALGIKGCFSSRIGLYERLLSGACQPASGVQRYGILNEPKAVAFAESHFGRIFAFTGSDQVSLVDGRYRTTPDGIDEDCVLEVKCRVADHWKDDSAWLHYMPQIQSQMAISGRDHCLFVAWKPEGSRAWWVEKSLDFFLLCVLGDKEFEGVDEFIRRLDESDPPKKRTNKRYVTKVFSELSKDVRVERLL